MTCLCTLAASPTLRLYLAQELRALPGMISQRREAEVRSTLEALLCHQQGSPAAASAFSHASPLATAAAAALGRGAAMTPAATTPMALATPAAASRCSAMHGGASPWAEVYVPFTASRPVAASRLTTPAPDARPPPASPAPADLMFADLPASAAAAAAAVADDQHDPKPPPESHAAAALGGAGGSASGSASGGAGDVDGAPQRTLPGAFLPAGFECTSPNTLFGELKRHKAEEHKASEASDLAAQPPPPPASVGPGMPEGAAAPAAAAAAGAAGAADVVSFCPAAEVASFEVASLGAAQCAEAEVEAEARTHTAHAAVPPEAAAEATAARMHMLIKSLVRLLQLDTLPPPGEEMVEMVEHVEEEAYEPFDESRHGSPTA